MASGQAVATWKTYRTLDGQPTGVNVKSSPGEVAGWFLANNANAVRYVLGNYRHHTLEYLQPDFRDEYATGTDLPLAEPKLWLLRIGWHAEPLRKQVPFEPP